MVDFKDFQKLRWYFQVLIVSGVCAAGLALLWNQYLSPIQDQIKLRNDEYSQLQATIAKSMKQAAEFEKLKKETETLQVQLDTLKRILPLEKETDQLLQLDLVAVRGERSDQNVLLPGVVAHQRAQGCQERHVEGGPSFEHELA